MTNVRVHTTTDRDDSGRLFANIEAAHQWLEGQGFVRRSKRQLREFVKVQSDTPGNLFASVREELPADWKPNMGAMAAKAING